ncbi:MAG: DUF481 domain-containing protein [Bdellovibrio sp.]|nr:DUF481 domain-containing protein [Bdellovibrio sp.]
MEGIVTKSLILFLTALSISFSAKAQEAAPPPPFKGTAEAGAILVTGNSDSENYAAKAGVSYTQGKHVYSAFGHYIKTEANNVESARNWDIGVRYDHAWTDYLGFYVGQKTESDIFAGYLQRDSTDVGLKYFLTKTDTFTWTLEAGYRYSKTQQVLTGTTYDQLMRIYSEVNKSFDKTFSFKYWAEYLPNMTDPDAYMFNTEASINVMLNSIFSLKLAYLLQYQNQPPDGGKYDTTTSTLNLVAKF